MSRDEKFWELDRQTIAVRNPRHFHALLHQRLREACNWAEVENLREHNRDIIERLDRPTKQDVIGALASREKELRGA